MDENKQNITEADLNKLKSLLKDLEEERLYALKEHQVRVLYHKTLQEILEQKLESNVKKELDGMLSEDEYRDSLDTYFHKIQNSIQMDFETSFNSINSALYENVINQVLRSLKKKTGELSEH